MHMTLDEIKALPVASIAKETAHLYLWMPNALLPEGLAVMEAWGFQVQEQSCMAVKSERMVALTVVALVSTSETSQRCSFLVCEERTLALLKPDGGR